MYVRRRARRTYVHKIHDKETSGGIRRIVKQTLLLLDSLSVCCSVWCWVEKVARSAI
jgi:hypothetical protein